jgi:tol-pal system protein YbgF
VRYSASNGMVTMKLHRILPVLLLGLLLASLPAFGASKEIIQLQTQVQLLQDQMSRMQQSFDERMGIMQHLIEQSTDNANKVGAAVTTLQNSLQTQGGDTGTRIDQMSAQVQSMHDSVDELKSRLAKVSKQLDDMVAAQQNLNAMPSAGQPGLQPQGQAPPPEVLYNNALRDYNAGKYDLAVQQFNDYLKYYGTSELAGNAQYYVADIEYRQGNFEAAVRDYDKVLEQYPGGNKAAAAQLKKGYALVELGQKDEGIRELNSLISRFPRSMEATQARERLKTLRASSATKKTPR